MSHFESYLRLLVIFCLRASKRAASAARLCPTEKESIFLSAPVRKPWRIVASKSEDLPIIVARLPPGLRITA
jgi:hypothetical protein